ncbi:Phosphatidylinositol N-acetyglucosaminlytransferase subunit P-related [Zea mays]|uniref:Phosphatidylinositol N-acetyglucosaminlytransferase subunit P-related n=1 Tax=Zea mays TaxID=4577 RepID=A0A1D6P739_MAIZE|nr:Phosphatidylinositol N-acetyglucosaminlytransferase subunit P-related [Zea mays]
MGRRGHGGSASQDDDGVGCAWGLMRMLYFRRDPKLLLDAKQLSGRHAFREVSERGHSAKRSKDFDEIEEDGKPTVKNLMEDELGKVKLLKKNPNDEIQRRLVDLGNDVSLGRSSEHTNKSIDRSYHQAGISTPSIPPMDSGVLNYAEEYDLESVLMNFLGEIYSCHDECPHSDCKNKNELCPSLKSLIHKKVNELNNLPRNIGCAQSQEGNDAKLSDQNNLSNTMAARSKQFKDALEILGSNNELFMKLLQKPNQHIVDSIQKHENSKVAAGLEPNKIHGQTNFLVGRGGSRQHPLATKEQAKERKYMFFWRKGKSNRRQMLEATDTDQTVTKIVILKPNPERGFNQKAATARTLHQQPCTSHAPECGGIDNSKFSIKEVKTRFRFVNSESRRESNLAPAEDLQGYPRKFKDSFVAINKDFRHFPEGSLANKSGSDIKNAIKPFISSKQNGSISGNSGHIVAPKGASIFYEEARRHLSEMLKDNDCSVNYPAVQISKSLEGILSLPHGNVSTPRSSLWGKDYLGPSPGETDVFVACEVQREECTQERSQSQEDFGSIARCTSAAVDDQVTVRDGYYTNEAQEGSRHAQNEPGLLYTEGIHKFICGKNICDEQSVPAEQSRHDVCQEILEEIKQGKEHIKMSPTSAEGIVETLGQQEPETPEPRASTELISDGSPEQSDEKQERPSPVSVLESFFEDIDNPDCINKKECELHGLQRTLYFPDNEPDVSLLGEDRSVRVDYIKLVLELSELCAEQNLEVWYLEDELISPCLFEELQSQGDQTDDLKLLFDCICEALTEIQERYFRLSWLTFLKQDIRTPPIGENLITEVDRYVYGYIQHSLPITLEQIIKRDLEVQTWMNIRSKTEGIIMEMWEFVLDELIDETVFDLWI